MPILQWGFHLQDCISPCNLKGTWIILISLDQIIVISAVLCTFIQEPCARGCEPPISAFSIHLSCLIHLLLIVVCHLSQSDNHYKLLHLSLMADSHSNTCSSCHQPFSDYNKQHTYNQLSKSLISKFVWCPWPRQAIVLWCTLTSVILLSSTLNLKATQMNLIQDSDTLPEARHMKRSALGIFETAYIWICIGPVIDSTQAATVTSNFQSTEYWKQDAQTGYHWTQGMA
jgi:hypothetical protein